MRFFLLIFLLFFFCSPAFSQHKPVKVGVVLSGGGAKGFAHIGVLKVLEEKKYLFPLLPEQVWVV